MTALYDVKNFETEVLEESRRIPVLVDFWASWCNPCRILGPVLEELAKANEGRFKLAKLNTEEFPEIASKYQIRGIPAVKLFIDGQITAEFTGALPKQQIEKWMDVYIPDENQKELNSIKEAIKNGMQSSEAEIKLQNLLIKAPELTECKIILASVRVFENPVEASRLVEKIYEDSPFYQTVKHIHTLAELALAEEKLDQIKNPALKEKLLNSVTALKNSNLEFVLENMIFLLQADKSMLDQLPRRVCIAIFNLLGNTHELSLKYRRRFDMSLY